MYLCKFDSEKEIINMQKGFNYGKKNLLLTIGFKKKITKLR